MKTYVIIKKETREIEMHISALSEGHAMRRAKAGQHTSIVSDELFGEPSYCHVDEYDERP